MNDRLGRSGFVILLDDPQLLLRFGGTAVSELVQLLLPLQGRFVSVATAVVGRVFSAVVRAQRDRLGELYTFSFRLTPTASHSSRVQMAVKRGKTVPLAVIALRRGGGKIVFGDAEARTFSELIDAF